MVYSMRLDANVMVHMRLFHKVTNASKLQQKIMKGLLNCCLIKPSLIVDPLQVVVAANKAVLAESFTTKNVYSEILFNLSISRNITQSLQKFGIDEKETNVLVVVICENGTNNLEEIVKEIDGEEVDMNFLNNLKNDAEIKKAYKLTDVEIQKLPLLDSVISKIAAKEFL